jgi:tetratricopeptide (TPR) repeat protein
MQEMIGAIASTVVAILALLILFLEGRSKKKMKSLARLAPVPVSVVANELPFGIQAPPVPYLAHPYPMPVNFTGRAAERKELTEWFADTHDAMFVYEAIGGMGKSAVTWYWLHEDVLKSDSQPDGVIWWSFYEKESRFETFIEKALIYFTGDEPSVKGIPSTYDRMQWLCQLLCKKRYLIILDGAERILRAYAGLGSSYQGDEVSEGRKDDYRSCVDPNAGTYLQWLTSPDIRSKILVTSRLFPRELEGLSGCRHKYLDKLDKDDAVIFFQQQGIKGTRAEIEAACSAYGYHPLSLRLLSGLILQDPQYKRDITAWSKRNLLRDETPREHNILELAYGSLNKEKRELISELAAFRNPTDYNSMVFFQRGFKNQQEFKAALVDLVDRGLLLRDQITDKYDLHPIIRNYCYDRLTDKQGVHSELQSYFETVPQPEKVESLADLDPLIELYHHTVNSGEYDEAFELFRHRINVYTYYVFGAYGLEIDLLRLLFPDGEDRPPRLRDEADQGLTLNALAISYSMSGQPRQAIPLYERLNELSEKQHDKRYLAIGLGNLAEDQLKTGAIDSAGSNLRQSIGICQEMNDEYQESVGHQELGHLLACCGKFEESEQELVRSTQHWLAIDDKQWLGVDYSYRVLRALLMSEPRHALRHAQKARELADAEHYERDIVLTEWLLGAAHLANGNSKEAESHLNEALLRDRRINLVELEASILLELAKLRHVQKHDSEALKLANEALTIADRCEYRLQQAEIHNFLAQYYFDTGDKAKAREHAEIAKERAECGYVPAIDQAKALLAKLQ